VSEINRLDRAVRDAERKLDAARNGEMWPLTASEKRKALTGLVGGGYKAARGKSTARADRNLDALERSVDQRLSAELSALQREHQAAVNKAAADKAAKKSSGWW
jgi:hypothetical protein